MTPDGIHHFAIKVRDLVAAERFYREVLGLSVLRRWQAQSGDGDRSVWLSVDEDVSNLDHPDVRDSGGRPDTADGLAAARTSPRHADRDGNRGATFLALEATSAGLPNSGETPPGAEHPGHHLFALRIRREQRADWETRLTTAGVTISHRSAYTLYFTDPEGNRLGLSHYPDAVESR